MSVHVDMDAIRAGLEPWDFSLVLDGKTYTVKRWTVEHSERAARAASDTGLRALLADLIEGELPDWDVPTCEQVLTAIVSYRQELGKRHAAQTRAAFAKIAAAQVK